ncbi:MAG: hypothetical protein IJA61_01950 [Clostridia bacterium]|nr:hypothetical protein [Clostridia bacterium]
MFEKFKKYMTEKRNKNFDKHSTRDLYSVYEEVFGLPGELCARALSIGINTTHYSETPISQITSRDQYIENIRRMYTVEQVEGKTVITCNIDGEGKKEKTKFVVTESNGKYQVQQDELEFDGDVCIGFQTAKSEWMKKPTGLGKGMMFRSKIARVYAANSNCEYDISDPDNLKSFLEGNPQTEVFAESSAMDYKAKTVTASRSGKYIPYSKVVDLPVYTASFDQIAQQNGVDVHSFETFALGKMVTDAAQNIMDQN